MQPTLSVFKASAGSGKTFTLAVEYIKLLIENPHAFMNILAVTFTNKATEEMKMRILSQLYGLAHGLKDSEAYLQVLLKDLKENGAERKGLSKTELREYIAQQAGEALHLLLHNYHYFRVQTIDTFFQSVLRNMARELQLNANLRVGLNNQEVVEEAVDGMIDSLSEDKQLRQVVMGYVSESIEADKNWNVIRNIKNFGGTIFREFYKQHRKEMNSKMSYPTFFEDYKKEMDRLVNSLPKKYAMIGENALLHLQENGLTADDFKYGAGGGGGISYFYKLAQGRFFDIDMEKARMKSACEKASEWWKKDSPNQTAVKKLVEEVLLPLMQKTESERQLDARRYFSAIQTRKHINDVRLLKNIEDSARNINEAAQRFMLSDTQSLLNDMVRGEDSPFIFEKIGTYLEHIMIDEFQDTSTVQWENFKKLLEECMSKGFSNIIVGDVKQSIYRFRSGDWRLLNDIDTKFPREQLEFKPRLTNYRSDRNVVMFNNTFFELAAKLEIADIQKDSPAMASQLQKAYADVSQKVPQKKDCLGFVHIDLLPEGEYSEMNKRVLDIISQLMSRGAKQRDIAILVRGNKEAVSIANDLESNGITVISAEAFKLDASMAVRVIIGAMKHLARPNDMVTLALLKKDCRQMDSGELKIIESELPEEFTEREDYLRSLSLHDMAEEIARIFKLGETEGAYLTAFYDQLHAFSNDNSTLLSDFIEAWDNDIHAKAIETPDSEGVRILTIHKSKGLEFKHVILPYCNWRLELGGGQIWCEPDEWPFNMMPLVPIDYFSVESLKKTIYREDAIEEHVQNIVDNLNLLYVAMTRAGSSLFILGKRTKPDKYGHVTIKRTHRSGLIEELIGQLPQEINDIPLHIDIPEDTNEAISVTYGKLEGIFTQETKSTQNDNVFLTTPLPLRIPVCSRESHAIFRQSNKSRAFSDDEYDRSDTQRYIRMGTVMHQVFSEIHTLDDVIPVLQRMEFDGALYDDNLTKEDLLAEMHKKFSNPQIKDWFSNRWQLYNECTILAKDCNGIVYEQRPDRVMFDGKETIVVDFKFGKPMPDNYEQVHKYMDLLSQMGMPDVKGYLWYVTFEEVLSVAALCAPLAPELHRKLVMCEESQQAGAKEVKEVKDK